MHAAATHARLTFGLGLAVLLTLSPVVEATTRSVNCAVRSIQSALSLMHPGDTLLVSGVCNENVVIDAHVENIVLDGQMTASIAGPVATTPTVMVRGRRITITGFTITGGNDGIKVESGGTAVIKKVTVTGVPRNGVFVAENSSARIVTSTIELNGGHGISVSNSSSANIGLLSVDDGVGGNTIQNNTSLGIFVGSSSSANILGNTIKGNGVDGIRVQWASHARISDNTIDQNAQSGIVVLENSGVNLGQGPATPFAVPNHTTVGLENGQFGIRCQFGGYARGPLDTLNGTLGDKDFDSTCIDDLS